MKQHMRKTLFWFCIVVCIVCVGYIAYYYIQKGQKNADYNKVKEEVTHKVPYNVEKPGDVIPIDFAKLKDMNEEIYAWIQIPDTHIDYPILQSKGDDAYYLTHAFDGKDGVMGAIFTEKLNAKDFTDFNTVIYGHIMKDQTMFTDLHKFEDEAFFESHDKVTIYTETERKVYKIFAAVEYDNRHILYHYDNKNPDERKAFLQSLFESRNLKNHYRKDVKVDENSNIITLSTCVRHEPEKRYVVGAVEVDE